MKEYRLQSSIWATLLMLVLFFASGLLGGAPTDGGRSQSPQIRRGAITPRTLEGRVVVIDPGHGGPDPGTVGVGRTTEAENVLAIAWELRSLLEGAGAEVIMTRQTDSASAAGTVFAGQENGELAARAALANRSGAQVFVSLHNDWSDDSGAAGATVYYYKSGDWPLADAVRRALVAQLHSADRGVQLGNFYVLRNTSMPAVLVEVGFLSNPREAELLSQRWYRLEAARGIFYGIIDYFQLMN